mmetsp:Transcript_72525/g.201105  ORF Transcript_72525/g.201105 Transcript_72525/m.201105 type:complete len:243 (-) Transcript_72525:70-798(-)
MIAASCVSNSARDVGALTAPLSLLPTEMCFSDRSVATALRAWSSESLMRNSASAAAISERSTSAVAMGLETMAGDAHTAGADDVAGDAPVGDKVDTDASAGTGLGPACSNLSTSSRTWNSNVVGSDMAPSERLTCSRCHWFGAMAHVVTSALPSVPLSNTLRSCKTSSSSSSAPPRIEKTRSWSSFSQQGSKLSRIVVVRCSWKPTRATTYTFSGGPCGKSWTERMRMCTQSSSGRDGAIMA